MNISEQNHIQILIMRENLRNLRIKKGLSLKDLAKIIQIKQKYLVDIENGKDFDIQFLFKLCHFYDIEIHKIFSL